MAEEKLRVFIGSSSESLPVVEIIERRLRENERLAVTPWKNLRKNLPGREPRAGKFGTQFLDSLLAAASSFDAAVLVFGPDDITNIRGKEWRVPRDNVVFELGLFMGHLGTERAIVVSPDESEANLRVLSNIGTLYRVTYPPPPKDSTTTPQENSERLSKALQKAIEELEEHLEALEPRINRGLSSVGVITPEIIRWLAKPLRGTANTIRNIALDMDQTWSIFRYDIFEKFRDVEIETIMIDWSSPQIQEMSSDTVSVENAHRREDEIIFYCNQHEEKLAARNVKFTCKAYSDIPVLHGFLLNQQRLLISLCSVEDARLYGAPNPYLGFDYPSRDETASYLLKAFNGWFDFRWNRSRPIWPQPVKE